jgi:N-methylhydantoinase B
VGVRLLDDDIWVMAMASGGGYGDPIKREPEMVRSDVAEGKVAPELAARIYGVMFKEGAVDEAATRAARQAIRERRLALASKPSGQDGAINQANGAPAIQRFAIGEELRIVSIGERRFIACADCGHLLCEAAYNYKLSAARIDGSLHEIDSRLFPDPAVELDDAIVYRQYLCPNCGVLFDNELSKAEDPPLWDVQVDSSEHDR